MTRVRTKAIRNMSYEDVHRRVREMRGELAKLHTSAAKGTLRKESGKIRATKRDIARLLTRATEMEYE